jgi:hypothetical protein
MSQQQVDAYRVAEVSAAGGPFEIVERAVPQPGPGHVRVAVDACGVVCHTDVAFVNTLLPGVTFPVVPARDCGRIEELGDGTDNVWRVGDRVAVGWFGGSDRNCKACRQGDFIVCENLKVPGWTYDGGFTDAVIAPVDALARIPDDLASTDAGPLAGAGVTTYNGLMVSQWRSSPPYRGSQTWVCSFGMNDSSFEGVWELAGEKPEYVEVLRVCHELAVQQSIFTAHDVNNRLSVLGIGNGRFNLRPLVSRGLIYELEEPPRSGRRISYGMRDIEGIGSALARLDPENPQARS